MKTKIKNAVSSKLSKIGLPILALCWISFFWGTTWIASKEGVKHMPALQLVAIRQFLGGIIYISFFLFKKNALAKRKTMENYCHTQYIKLRIEQRIKHLGCQVYQQWLGSDNWCVCPVVDCHYFLFSRRALV